MSKTENRLKNKLEAIMKFQNYSTSPTTKTTSSSSSRNSAVEKALCFFRSLELKHIDSFRSRNSSKNGGNSSTTSSSPKRNGKNNSSLPVSHNLSSSSLSSIDDTHNSQRKIVCYPTPTETLSPSYAQKIELCRISSDKKQNIVVHRVKDTNSFLYKQQQRQQVPIPCKEIPFKNDPYQTCYSELKTQRQQNPSTVVSSSPLLSNFRTIRYANVNNTRNNVPVVVDHYSSCDETGESSSYYSQSSNRMINHNSTSLYRYRPLVCRNLYNDYNNNHLLNNNGGMMSNSYHETTSDIPPSTTTLIRTLSSTERDYYSTSSTTMSSWSNTVRRLNTAYSSTINCLNETISHSSDYQNQKKITKGVEIKYPKITKSYNRDDIPTTISSYANIVANKISSLSSTVENQTYADNSSFLYPSEDKHQPTNFGTSYCVSGIQLTTPLIEQDKDNSTGAENNTYPLSTSSSISCATQPLFKSSFEKTNQDATRSPVSYTLPISLVSRRRQFTASSSITSSSSSASSSCSTSPRSNRTPLLPSKLKPQEKTNIFKPTIVYITKPTELEQFNQKINQEKPVEKKNNENGIDNEKQESIANIIKKFNKIIATDTTTTTTSVMKNEDVSVPQLPTNILLTRAKSFSDHRPPEDITIKNIEAVSLEEKLGETLSTKPKSYKLDNFETSFEKEEVEQQQDYRKTIINHPVESSLIDEEKAFSFSFTFDKNKLFDDQYRSSPFEFKDNSPSPSPLPLQSTELDEEEDESSSDETNSKEETTYTVETFYKSDLKTPYLTNNHQVVVIRESTTEEQFNVADTLTKQPSSSVITTLELPLLKQFNTGTVIDELSPLPLIVQNEETKLTPPVPEKSPTNIRMNNKITKSLPLPKQQSKPIVASPRAVINQKPVVIKQIPKYTLKKSVRNDNKPKVVQIKKPQSSQVTTSKLTTFNHQDQMGVTKLLSPLSMKPTLVKQKQLTPQHPVLTFLNLSIKQTSKQIQTPPTKLVGNNEADKIQNDQHPTFSDQLIQQVINDDDNDNITINPYTNSFVQVHNNTDQFQHINNNSNAECSCSSSTSSSCSTSSSVSTVLNNENNMTTKNSSPPLSPNLNNNNNKILLTKPVNGNYKKSIIPLSQKRVETLANRVTTLRPLSTIKNTINQPHHSIGDELSRFKITNNKISDRNNSTTLLPTSSTLKHPINKTIHVNNNNNNNNIKVNIKKPNLITKTKNENQIQQQKIITKQHKKSTDDDHNNNMLSKQNNIDSSDDIVLEIQTDPIEKDESIRSVSNDDHPQSGKQTESSSILLPQSKIYKNRVRTMVNQLNAVQTTPSSVPSAPRMDNNNKLKNGSSSQQPQQRQTLTRRQSTEPVNHATPALHTNYAIVTPTTEDYVTKVDDKQNSTMSDYSTKKNTSIPTPTALTPMNNGRPILQRAVTISEPKVNTNIPLSYKRRVPLIRSTSNVKDGLMRWCQAQVKDYPNVNVTNLSSSWSDGMAFCALTHKFFSDAFDYNTLKPTNRKENFELAFRVAEERGGIPRLLDVQDMITMGNSPDYKCIFTYLNSFLSKVKDIHS